MSPDVERRVEAALAALQEDGEERPQDIRQAAVALLLRGASFDELEVLLMKRAEREGDRWSGQISLPGGHEEDDDEDLVATARRESREEVGVDPGAEDARLFGSMPSIQARARGARIALYITPVVFHRTEPESPTLGPEAAEAFWLPLGRIRTGELDRPYRYEHEGVIHRLPSWDFRGHTIWGMTHGILSRFTNALERADA
ncbi:MAG: CoA pyrophosphatase [Planctomycetota bacterium]